MNEEELKEIICSQRKIIDNQQEGISLAIDMLEKLVIEDDVNPEKIESIIKVLTYV